MWMWVWMVAAHAECVPPAELVPLAIDQTSEDTVPPTVADASSLTIDVARGEPDGCAGRCPPRLTIKATMDPEDDNVTAAADLGYVFRLVNGTLPVGIDLPDGPVLGPDLVLEWDLDPEEIRGTQIDIEVEVRTVDEAGNESTGHLTIAVDEAAPDLPEEEASGCSHGGPPLWLAFLGWFARRRQVRSSTTSSG